MMNTKYMVAALGFLAATTAHADRINFDDYERMVNMAYDMGWSCYDSTNDLMTVECGSFIRFFESEYAAFAGRFQEEIERSGILFFRRVEEWRIEEVAYMAREINELSIFAESIRKRTMSED